ncbi:MAG: hypothetical protein QM758_09520 [Armatimonas sp.]
MNLEPIVSDRTSTPAFWVVLLVLTALDFVLPEQLTPPFQHRRSENRLDYCQCILLSTWDTAHALVDHKQDQLRVQSMEALPTATLE